MDLFLKFFEDILTDYFLFTEVAWCRQYLHLPCFYCAVECPWWFWFCAWRSEVAFFEEPIGKWLLANVGDWTCWPRRPLAVLCSYVGFVVLTPGDRGQWHTPSTWTHMYARAPYAHSFQFQLYWLMSISVHYDKCIIGFNKFYSSNDLLIR